MSPDLNGSPKSAPRPGWLIRDTVVSSLITEADAEEDALNRAREKVEQKLAELDPPVKRTVSLGEVKSEFLRKDSRRVHPPTEADRSVLEKANLSGNYVRVESDF